MARLVVSFNPDDKEYANIMTLYHPKSKLWPKPKPARPLGKRTDRSILSMFSLRSPTGQHCWGISSRAGLLGNGGASWFLDSRTWQFALPRAVSISLPEICLSCEPVFADYQCEETSPKYTLPVNSSF
jgi:hypothetical protein